MDKITTDYMITLADLSEDALYQLYNEAISKLRSNSITHQERKVYTIRVCMIRSIISDKYSLKARHSTPYYDDDPLNNPNVSRFFR